MKRGEERGVIFASGAMLRTFSLGAVLVQGRGRANRGNLILSKCQTSKIKCRWETLVCRCAFVRRLPFFLSLSLSPPISFPPPRSLPLLAYFTLLRISVFIKIILRTDFSFHKLTFVRKKLNLSKFEYVDYVYTI